MNRGDISRQQWIDALLLEELQTGTAVIIQDPDTAEKTGVFLSETAIYDFEGELDDTNS